LNCATLTTFLAGLKDAIATLMDDGAMNTNPIHSISFFGYSPQSPPQYDDEGDFKSTTHKRFMLKRSVKAQHAGVCPLGLDEKDRTLQICYANSHTKLPKPAKGLFQGQIPGTLVCLQFQSMSLKDARTQLTLAMDAVRMHALFDASAVGLDVNVILPKGLQPSTVFTRCNQDPHSKVFIYPGLLLSTPQTPDTEGFAVMLSKHDLGLRFQQGRERCVDWHQVQGSFVRAIASAAMAKTEMCAVMTRLQNTFKGILQRTTHEIQRTSAFFHYFCEKLALEAGSVEQQLFVHLRGQGCIYVDAADSQYAQEVFGQSRRVVGVVSSRLLKVLHLPSPPPTKPDIVDTALQMLCVPAAVWKRPLTGGGWDIIHETFGDRVPLAYNVDIPSKFIGTSNRWIEIDDKKCLVLSKDAEEQLTAQMFYFMIIEHEDIRPLVSQKFWTLLTDSALADEDEDDDVPLSVLFPTEACEGGGGSSAALLTTPPPVSSSGRASALHADHGASAVPSSTPSTAPKRPLHKCDEGDLRDVLSTDGRQLNVRVLKARFDTVRVSVDANVRFEAFNFVDA